MAGKLIRAWIGARKLQEGEASTHLKTITAVTPLHCGGGADLEHMRSVVALLVDDVIK